MKKLWKKFKSWLIHKLGGYEERIVTVEKTIVPIVTLTSHLIIDEDMSRFPEDEEWILNQLAHDLADELRPYIKLRVAENHMDYFNIKKEYVAEIKIATNK